MALAAFVQRVDAQAVPERWRVTGEVGGIVGGTWLSGPRVPTVSTDPGAALGIGVQRGITPDATAGFAVRISSQAVSLREVGSSWSRGTLTEGDVVGQLSFASRRRTRLRLALDLGGGFALLSGARDLLPFLDASSIAPLGDIGLSLHRGQSEVDASRRDLALYVRYTSLRLDASLQNAVTTSGWVGRISTGLRVTR